MKLLRKITVISIITSFAVITGSARGDHSCESGSSFPFSLLSGIFDTGNKNTFIDKHKPGEKVTLLSAAAASAAERDTDIKVTLIELGSVNCVPCRMMKPVLKQIEQKYESQVKVVYYDIWTDKEKPYADKYRIRAIPTQVFLDGNGKEYFRHTGFFPLEDIEKVLKEQGVR